jgi:hypothetical protein
MHCDQSVTITAMQLQLAHTCIRAATASQWPLSAHTARAAPMASGRSAPGSMTAANCAASAAASSEGGSPLDTARRDSSSSLGSGRGWADELQGGKQNDTGSASVGAVLTSHSLCQHFLTELSD